jgi:YHS domain-containing protein
MIYMNNILLKIALPSLLLLTACNSTPTSNQEPENRPIPVKMNADAKKTDFDAKTLASATDPVCGMPVGGGVSDTTMYQGKVYGFCNEACKHNFVENPEQYLSVK